MELGVLEAACGIFVSGANEVGGLLQAHEYQQENIMWTQKAYRLDILAFSLDMVSHLASMW